MKIDDPLKKPGGLGQTATPSRTGKGAEKSAAATSTAATSDSGSVRLSATAQALAQSGSSSGVFDAQKVDEIKAAIANGTFRVDPDKVANGLMDTVSDLIRARK